MGHKNPAEKVKRRSVLKTAAASAFGVSMIGGVASGDTQSKSDRIYQQALRVREKTGSVQKFRKYLSNNGFGVGTDDSAYVVPEGPDDEPSIDYLDKTDLEIYLTVSSGLCTDPNDNYFVDINWSWSKDWDDAGEKPRDQVGIRWDSTQLLMPEEGGDEYYSDDYEYSYCTNGGLCYSGQTTEYSNSSGEGIAFGYMDRSSAVNGNNHHGGCKLRKITDQDLQNIQVRGSYEHNWSSSIKSVGISYGGMTVNYSTSGDNSWYVDRKQDGSGARIATNLGEATCEY